jgi:hypothetical protein
MESVDTSKKTASGIVYTGHSWLYDMLIGTDGVNNPTITVYDGIDNSGVEKIPTNAYDASALGINGVVYNAKRKCAKGIYVEITCVGTVEVVVGYKGL